MKYLLFCMREVSPWRRIRASLLGVPIGLLAVAMFNARHAPISAPMLVEIKRTARTTEVKHGPLNKEVFGARFAPESYRRHDNNAICFRYDDVCDFYGINRISNHQRMQPGASLSRSNSAKTSNVDT